MEKPSYKLVGAPCGQHGQYTFYKAIRLTGSLERIVAIGDFFFVRIWQDSELVSIGELQLLWTDRVSDQTLVSLRLYFLPENTPDGRGLHGEDEVLAINDKVVLRAEDLLSWVCAGAGWRWGLKAVWRGACAPPTESCPTSPLHHTKLDFSDVDREKAVDTESPGVVVFSYPRYCRYRALVARLEGIQADWLRDSLVAALGGYAAPTVNTRILYCKDTFEYPELEGHEFVCNHLAPKLKGRPRGRRRTRPRSRDQDHDIDRDSRSSDSDATSPPPEPRTPKRITLRNGNVRSDEDVSHRTEDESDRRDEGRREDGRRHEARREESRRAISTEDEAFIEKLREFHKDSDMKISHTKNISLRELYNRVQVSGGYEATCRARLWKSLYGDRAPRANRLYERYLLRYENHERCEPRNGLEKFVTSPRESPKEENVILDNETGELIKDEINIISKPAEELNREFLESLPKEEKAKISVKPVEVLVEETAKPKVMEFNNDVYLNDLPQKLQLGNSDSTILKEISEAQSGSTSALTCLSSLGDKYAVNGHAAAPQSEQKIRPVGRSSLRAVRVKPTRPQQRTNTPPTSLVRTDSTSSSPQPLTPITNFGIHHPKPPNTQSDDEIVEVPYKPKTPEIIDLDEYPESPQGVKKKKLEVLKERGLEVTAVPHTPVWPHPSPLPVPITPITPLINPSPIILNPAIQHQIMSQAQLFQMYNIVPPSYANGVVPPKVIQSTSAYGTTGPEKTVYGNPKDPFMPPPHMLQGTPIKPQRSMPSAPTTPQDILDLTCKPITPPLQKPSVEIVRISESPSKTPQNLSKNYTLLDGKAVVGSNLEITLVNPKTPTPPKRPPQKRSSNGKFISAKTPTPPKEYKPYPPPSPSGIKKPQINVPNYQIRDDISPTSSTGSKDSSGAPQNLLNVFKGQNLTQMMDMQKNVPMTPFMDPMYMNAFYSSLGQMDQRQLAMYRDFMANQFRGYSGLLNIGTPTTKN